MPKHEYTAWADYVQSLGNRGTVTYLTSVAWTDEFPAGGRPTSASPLSVAPAFLRWDARVSWTNLDGQWTVAGFVNNILDEIGVRNQFTYAASQGHRRVIEPTNPRWWGLEVHYEFGAYWETCYRTSRARCLRAPFPALRPVATGTSASGLVAKRV